MPFNSAKPLEVPLYANQLFYQALRACPEMSEADRKGLESMARNLKDSYAWYMEKASNDLKEKLEEKDEEITNLQKSQEVRNELQSTQAQAAAAEHALKELKEKEDKLKEKEGELKEKEKENIRLQDRLKELEQKLRRQESINNDLGDSLNIAERKLWVKEAEMDRLKDDNNRLLSENSRLLCWNNSQRIEELEERLANKDDKLNSTEQKLYLLQMEHQDVKEKLEDANDMLTAHKKREEDIASRLSREGNELAKFTQVELCEQVVLLDELAKKLSKELDFEKGEKEMVKKLLKMEANKTIKVVEDNNKLESRLARYAQEKKRKEEQKARNRKVVGTQTDISAQWNRRDGFSANAQVPRLGQEKTERDQKTRND
ncbi:unnamed protein product [Caenorhabditis brenneri]